MTEHQAPGHVTTPAASHRIGSPALGIPAEAGVLAVALVALLVAFAARIPLLWDDVWAPGYDGWYYVLQVRSVLAGAPLFDDASLVYPALAALGWLTGDVVLGNKVGCCLFAGLGAAGVAIGGTRWTGSPAAGLVAGLWWACAPGHLVVSSEFLKNEAGLAVLGLLLAVLPGAERRVALWLPALLLVALGPFVHKLTGVFGLALGVGYAGLVAGRGRVPPWVVIAGGGVLVAGVAAWGLIRPVDLARLAGTDAVGGDRFGLILGSHRVQLAHRATLLLAHALPVLGLLGLVGTGGRRFRDLGVPVVLVALATTALGLPFGFDLTSWRLLLLAFVPTAALLAVLVARTHPVVALPLALLAVGSLPWTVPHAARAEPDYQAWSGVLPVIRARVPPSDRVVAHRGVCGFVWAVGDRICENFEPQGPPDGWWRIAYGMGERRLAPFSEVEPVRLLPAYTLLPERAWRDFRATHGDELPLTRHPLNPYRPRPAFVYGPGGDTPRPEDGD